MLHRLPLAPCAVVRHAHRRAARDGAFLRATAALLEELDVEGPRVRLVATFEDGARLFASVCERGLEGVVAKRKRDPYRPASASG